MINKHLNNASRNFLIHFERNEESRPEFRYRRIVWILHFVRNEHYSWLNILRYLIFSILFLCTEISVVNPQAPPDIHKYPPLPDRYFSDILKTKSRHYAFKNVNIIPINMEVVLRGYDVIVKDGKIQKIGLSNQVDIPPNCEIIEGRGKYLIPGLTDMHVHFYQENDLILFLANGVTTVRNMQGEPYHLRMREKIKKGLIFGPTIFTASPYVTALDNPLTARKVVEMCKKDGYDYIKIMEYLKEDAYKEVIKAARENNIKCIGHIPFDGGLETAVNEGQYSIEHILMILSRGGSFRDSLESAERIGKIIDILSKSGTWVCPILVPSIYEKGRSTKEELFDDPNLIYIHPAILKKWFSYDFNNIFHDSVIYSATKKLFDKGGKLLLGTDCGIPVNLPGFSLHKELKCLVAAGLTPYQALRIGTYNSAECLGTLSQSGTIEEGKIADLVLLSNNPLENIQNTKNIDGVMTKGVWFSRGELDNMLKDISEYYVKNTLPMFGENGLPQKIKEIFNKNRTNSDVELEDSKDSTLNLIKYVMIGSIILIPLLIIIFLMIRNRLR